MRTLHFYVALLCLWGAAAFAQAPSRPEPVLGVGDGVRMSVYQNPDLSIEARISENGQINVPLLGPVKIGGLSVPQAQLLIEKMLRDGKASTRCPPRSATASSC